MMSKTTTWLPFLSLISFWLIFQYLIFSASSHSFRTFSSLETGIFHWLSYLSLQFSSIRWSVFLLCRSFHLADRVQPTRCFSVWANLLFLSLLKQGAYHYVFYYICFWASWLSGFLSFTASNESSQFCKFCWICLWIRLILWTLCSPFLFSVIILHDWLTVANLEGLKRRNWWFCWWTKAGHQ